MFNSTSDLYLRHFTRYLGKPFDIERYRTEDGDALRVATFDLRYKGFKVYASLGLADEPEMPDLGEVILLTDDFRPDVKQLFVHFVLFMLQHNIPLGSRFSIGGIETLNNEFADHYGKTALYVTPAQGFDPGFDVVPLDDEEGRVYQALFLSASEQDYVKRHGGEAFEEKLRRQEAKGMELCALARPSCV